MMSRILAVLLAGVLGGAVQAASPEDFSGRWRSPDPVGLTVEQSAARGGFTLTMTAAEPETAINARFAQGDGPDRFVGTDNGAPLEGEPLIWARLEGEELVVYSMTVQQGGAIVLERFARRRDGEVMVFSLQARVGMDVTLAEGSLEPVR
jgi:hypothetical protein